MTYSNITQECADTCPVVVELATAALAAAAGVVIVAFAVVVSAVEVVSFCPKRAQYDVVLYTLVMG